MAEETPETPRVFRLILRRPKPCGNGLEEIVNRRFAITDKDARMMDSAAARQRLGDRQKDIPQGLDLEIVEESFEVSRGAPVLTVVCTNPACKGPGLKGATDCFCRHCGKPLSITLTPSTELVD